MKNIIKISKDSLERIKLNEAKRTELINKSKSADNYSITNQSRGKNRYERRKYSKVASSVRQYKNLDMDAFFKRDVLTVNIEVQGETNDYIVTVRMTGVLKEVLKQFEQSGDMKLNAKILNKALIKVFNSSDLQIKCSCLHPDTKIKLLDGSTPTIEEMCKRYDSGEELWVFSVDGNGDFKPGKVEKVWKTKTTTDFIKVTLDNGEEILTTPEHPYMLRSGSYCLAEHLEVGQSLMPIYTSKTKNNYDTVKLNSTGKYHSIYKLVADEVYKELIKETEDRAGLDESDTKFRYRVAVHHKDFNKQNNSPQNLQIMTANEHWKYHADLSSKNLNLSEEGRKKLSELAYIRNANPTDKMIKQREEFLNKGTLRNYDSDRKAQQSKIAKEVNDRFWHSDEYKEQREQYMIKHKEIMSSDAVRDSLSKSHKSLWANMSDEEYQRRCEQNHNTNIRVRNNKIKNVIDKMIQNNVPLNGDNYNKSRVEKDITLKKILEVFGTFDNMLTELGYNDKFNHRVVKVERVELEDTPVYDIKVEKWENFALDAGVVVHNCPDGKYRHNYWQWKNNYGVQYEPRPSDITNPNDTKGSGCKHTMLVLSNVTWLIKVSSVIVNYIRYCQEHLQKNYAEYIFPKLYGMPYKKAVQLHLFNNGWFPQDQQTMSAIINKGLQGRDEKGRFIKKINPNEEPKQQIGNKPVQQQFEFDDVDDDTKKVLGYKKPNKPKAMSLFRDYDDNGNVIGQGEDIPEPKPKHPTVKSLSNKAPTNKSIKKPVVSNGQLSFNFDDEEDNN